MANANVNKVVLGSSTLIDLTSDTITAENVIEGYTFHKADGSTVSGTLTHLTNAEIDEITGSSGGGGSSVTVEALSVTANGTYTAPSGTAYSPVTVNVPTPAPSLQSKSVTPSTSQQTVQPDSGYDGLSSVTVGAIPSQYIVPSGSLAITENGTGIDVTSYASVDVAVPSCWELIASTTLTGVVQTSTSNATAGTVSLGSAAYTKDAIIWVHVRDAAGARAGYFYGSDAIFINSNKRNGGTSTFTAPGVTTIRYSTSSQFASYTGAYGVWGYSITSAGLLTLRKRYNSNYSLTINGDYKVDVYRLTPPDGMVLFPI